jgi:hypothetical protein
VSGARDALKSYQMQQRKRKALLGRFVECGGRFCVVWCGDGGRASYVPHAGRYRLPLSSLVVSRPEVRALVQIKCGRQYEASRNKAKCEESVDEPIVGPRLFSVLLIEPFFEAAQIAKSCKLCKVVYHTSSSTMTAMLQGRRGVLCPLQTVRHRLQLSTREHIP